MPQAALRRWLVALNTQGDPGAVREAVSPDCELLRYGWGEDAEVVKEHFHGPEAISGWLGRTPKTTVFQLEGPLAAAGEHWEQRYLVGIEDFQNRGCWRFRLGTDGRIARLEHRPDALPAPA